MKGFLHAVVFTFTENDHVVAVWTRNKQWNSQVEYFLEVCLHVLSKVGKGCDYHFKAISTKVKKYMILYMYLIMQIHFCTRNP